MIAQKGGEDIKQVVIRLSDDVHAKLKLKTVKENTSIQDVVERFIKFYVSSDEPVNINFKTTESVEKIHSDNDNRVLKIIRLTLCRHGQRRLLKR